MLKPTVSLDSAGLQQFASNNDSGGSNNIFSKWGLWYMARLYKINQHCRKWRNLAFRLERIMIAFERSALFVSWELHCALKAMKLLEALNTVE
jgi:hypothetical protein